MEPAKHIELFILLFKKHFPVIATDKEIETAFSQVVQFFEVGYEYEFLCIVYNRLQLNGYKVARA
jgi:hypothetical protein